MAIYLQVPSMAIPLWLTLETWVSFIKRVKINLLNLCSTFPNWITHAIFLNDTHVSRTSNCFVAAYAWPNLCLPPVLLFAGRGRRRLVPKALTRRDRNWLILLERGTKQAFFDQSEQRGSKAAGQTSLSLVHRIAALLWLVLGSQFWPPVTKLTFKHSRLVRA